jgi:hypothetical protein
MSTSYLSTSYLSTSYRHRLPSAGTRWTPSSFIVPTFGVGLADPEAPAHFLVIQYIRLQIRKITQA